MHVNEIQQHYYFIMAGTSRRIDINRRLFSGQAALNNFAFIAHKSFCITRFGWVCLYCISTENIKSLARKSCNCL
ncbi:hypothetical protein X798_03651 [Onchocerca flexuosa]|uniref:Uncharacterized protein n=1 Tax=Onchocerca flexuosa TaxID=387005 RepID=A0A238BX66_9BILA|nr:hypothetical protein X798_03651 [Onchocerca flexuosa]